MSTAAMASWIVTGAASLIRSLDGASGEQRLAEVAVRKTLDVLDVLHVERPVEAALVADEGDALGVGALPGQGDGRIAGHELEHREGDEGDAEQHENELQQPSDDVRDQRGTFTRTTPLAGANVASVGNRETARGVGRGPSRVCVHGFYSVAHRWATAPHIYLTHTFHMSVRAKEFQLKPPIRAELEMRASRYV